MNSIATSRLRLVAATAELVRLEMEHRNEFFKRLEVATVSDWPSENLSGVLPFFLERLENDPSLVGWLAWYWIDDTEEPSRLVGGGGFKGAPANGVVEIGYETRAVFRRHGFASEAVGAQVAWALEHPEVSLVFAESRSDNQASMGVLRKLGFVQVGPGSEAGLLRLERTRSER